MTLDEHAVVVSSGRSRGRPRAVPGGRTGVSTRQEILEVASQLFRTQGYNATTTRQIADAVGIKQASLYYHFADKGELLRTLLISTVAPSVEFGEWLRGQQAAAVVKLHALTRFDLDGLIKDEHNLHALYRMPDVSQRDRVDSERIRAALLGLYRALAGQVIEELGRQALTGDDLDLVFGLVESVISHRDWGGGGSRAAYASAVARGCLRLLAVPEERIREAEEDSRRLVDTYRSPPDPA